MRINVNDYEANEVIRILREWSELKQQDFGKSIGLSRMAIQSYELGKRKYKFETLLKIANKYGYTIIIERKK